MKYSLFRKIIEILPKNDKKKIWLVIVLQIGLNFLDLIGIGLIGVLGALAVSGVESGKPGNRVSAALKILGLAGKSLQTQVTILGICAAFLLIFRTAISIWLSKKTLRFISRRSAYISSELIRSLFSKNILEIQNYTQAEIVYNITSTFSIVPRTLCSRPSHGFRNFINIFGHRCFFTSSDEKTSF